MLLEAGARVDAADEGKQTPLLRVAEYGRTTGEPDGPDAVKARGVPPRSLVSRARNDWSCFFVELYLRSLQQQSLCVCAVSVRVAESIRDHPDVILVV